MGKLQWFFNFSKHTRAISNSESTQTPAPVASHLSATSTLKLEDAFSLLSRFDIRFLLDDSTSMAGKRFQEATKVLRGFAGAVAKYNEHGIKIQFFNSSKTLTINDSQGMAHCLESFSLTPKSPLGTKLGNLLDNYMEHLKVEGAKLKPMILVIITDGVPTDGVQTEEAVMRAAKDLNRCNTQPKQIVLQFVQTGKEQRAIDYLQRLDDTLTFQENRIMVSTTPLNPDIELDLLKILLDTINQQVN
ncbi:hypothetical protein J132_02387 [Termitomyces sp. J132]|nr:hypothetical protein H2248_002183 [Termitomyces sp. 'cryptogamus']KNZ81190.1 hypothetical protein J132_02387 [Termitomyces sp. J132]